MSAYNTKQEKMCLCGAVQKTICLGLNRSSAMKQRAGGESVQVYVYLGGDSASTGSSFHAELTWVF